MAGAALRKTNRAGEPPGANNAGGLAVPHLVQKEQRRGGDQKQEGIRALAGGQAAGRAAAFRREKHPCHPLPCRKGDHE